MHDGVAKAMSVAALRGAVITAAILSFVNLASAVPLPWTLNNVSFDDGGTAVGSFNYDAATNTYSDFSISVAGGDTTLFPPFVYSPATSFLRAPLEATDLSLSSNDVVLVPLPGGGVRGDRRTLFMTFEEPLTGAGGSIRVLSPAGLGGDAEFNSLSSSPPFGQRGFTGGTVSAIPEPSSVVLMILGLGALATSSWLTRKPAKWLLQRTM